MKNKALWIVGGILVVVIAFLWTSYNGLVAKNEAVDSQWAQVETQYQRRLDLIPNLVEATKGVMKQEQAIFGAIADARTKYGAAKTIDEKASAATGVESALSRLLLIIENYPNLKSADNVQALQVQLEGTENRVSVERMRFNETVQAMNLAVKRFPANLIAGMFGFNERQYFEAAGGAEKAPEVKF